MPQHLIQGSLRRSVSAKPVFEVPEIRRGATVAGNEDDVLDRCGGGQFQQLLRNYDGSDRVSAEMEGEVQEGCSIS
jgi:hypothetical protein